MDAAPRRNVELKALDPDPDATLERALAAGARDHGVLRQRDTYFETRRGRLKLREEQPGGAHLIAYERPDDAAARQSAYRVVAVGAPRELRAALDAALGVTHVVDKRRRLLLWDTVRIHLDDVAGLGRFVELEAVAAEDSDLAREHGQLRFLCEVLGIADEAIQAGSYADALAGRGGGGAGGVGASGLPDAEVVRAGAPDGAGPHAAVAAIRARAPGFAPRLALVLGSGLGELAAGLAERVELPYDELPGFRAGSVAGHAGTLVLGRHAGVPVAVLRGRYHVYEGADGPAVATPVRALKLLGAEALVVTNAAGSLRAEAGPGSLVAIADHVNLMGFNPLTGPNDDAFGPRFPSLADAYDPELRARLHAHARALSIQLHEGVYLATAGPTFETPAEVRAFRTLGADLVGMSTVPEVIVARHCGLRVAAVSVVTNLAEGMGDEQLSHEHTLAQGQRGARALRPLLERLVEHWP